MAIYIPPITIDEYRSHDDASDGVCLCCGEWSSGGVEPDGHDYKCHFCGAMRVWGTQDAMMAGYVTIGD